MLSEAQRAVITAHLRRGRADAPAGGPARPAAGSPLVELTGAAAAARPLFLVHAIGGTVHPYAPLAARLADDLRVYGVEAAGLAAGSAPAASLDAMAAGYLAAIRSAQPEGAPYRLAGWSMGGLVAYELARRLEADGEQVAALVLLDPPFHMLGFNAEGPAPASADEAGRSAGADRPADGPSDRQVAAWFVADAARTLGPGAGPSAAPGPAECGVAEQLDWLARRLEAGDGGSGAAAAAGVADVVRAEIGRRFAVFQAHIRLIGGYRPQAALRTRTLLVSARHSPNAAAAPRWVGLLGEQAATVLDVPADHYTFLQPPLVDEVADRIRAWQGEK